MGNKKKVRKKDKIDRRFSNIQLKGNPIKPPELPTPDRDDDPTAHTMIESWEPMEQELSAIRRGAYDNTCSLFNLDKEQKAIDECKALGKTFRSPFHTARELIYHNLLLDRKSIEKSEVFSSLTESNIVLACKQLYEFNGFDGASHKEVWKYIPSDAHFLVDAVWEKVEEEIGYLED
jgi:hypothetical protein